MNKYRAVICALAKNENKYINEWVNYHLAIGFDHIYIYDNNDDETPYVGAFMKPILNNSLSNQGKTIVRSGLDYARMSSCHYASNKKTGGILIECTPSGRLTTSAIDVIDYENEVIFLNHYRTKTISEFVEQKVNRGDACWENNKIDLTYFWKTCRKTDEKTAWLTKHGIK